VSRPRRVVIDARVMGFCLGLSLVSALLIGLVPALRLSGAACGEGLALHAGEARATGGRQGERLRALLVAGPSRSIRDRQVDSGIVSSPAALRRRRRRNDAQAVLWEAGPMAVWQPRFYDFNVWTERKRVEKLRYMHCNPVKRGLVQEPEQWLWSSFRYYNRGQPGRVQVNDCDIMRMRETARVAPAPAPCEKAARSGAPKT